MSLNRTRIHISIRKRLAQEICSVGSLCWTRGKRGERFPHLTPPLAGGGQGGGSKALKSKLSVTLFLGDLSVCNLNLTLV